MCSSQHEPDEHSSAEVDRRTVLRTASSLAMVGSLAVSHGAFAAIAGRFFYPAKPQAKRWVFVAELGKIKSGRSLLYHTPTGATVTITRQRQTGTAGEFTALSSVCPHLGCQVHWEPMNNRFFCPCHNGAFDASGKATSGPPAEAGQSLSQYPLKVEKGLLYIEVPVDTLAES